MKIPLAAFTGLLLAAAWTLPAGAATLFFDHVVDLDAIDTSGTQITVQAPISSGPVSVSVGDTIHLKWTFANNRVLEMTAANQPRFLGGLRIPNVAVTIDNQSLMFLGLSGDPVNNPSFKGETSVGTLDAFFQEPETDLDNGEVIRFTGLEFMFDVTALGTNPNLYEETRLVIRSGTNGGSFAVVPEPSRVLLSLLGVAAVLAGRGGGRLDRDGCG